MKFEINTDIQNKVLKNLTNRFLNNVSDNAQLIFEEQQIKKEMRTLHPIVYAFCLLISFVANATTAPHSIFDSFQEEDVLDITISTNFERILNDMKLEEYQPAQFSYKMDGQTYNWDIKVKQRGRFRRRTCEMPPLKLNFSKKDLEQEGLAKFDKMKLVTYCMDDGTGKENVLKEYLAYKLYNELTPYSFRVQLVRVAYVDTQKSMRKIKRFGFLIESTSELEARIGAEEVEKHGIAASELHQKQEALAAEFQYLIGNADWNTAVMHNTKLMQKSPDAPVILVPYDFDFSGLVNAAYAKPNRNVGQETITQRVFMGNAPSNRTAMQNYFQSKKSDMYEVINNFKFLNWDVQLEMTNYLDTYFNPAVDNVDYIDSAVGK